MKLVKKTFQELSTSELYEILRSRAEIFVVEQNCIYQDLDGMDEQSLHIFYQDEDGRVRAYLRMFSKADEPGTVKIGRVLTLVHGEGLGGKLLHEGIETARSIPGVKKLYVEAQSYASGFYARKGFEITSDEFLEDGIPHVQMRMTL